MLEHLLHAFSKDRTKQSQEKHQGAETQEDKEHFNKRILRPQQITHHFESHLWKLEQEILNQFHFTRKDRSPSEEPN